MESWRRNQVAVIAASLVGFTGFTLVMPFLARYVQELGVADTGEEGDAPLVAVGRAAPAPPHPAPPDARCRSLHLAVPTRGVALNAPP